MVKIKIISSLSDKNFQNSTVSSLYIYYDDKIARRGLDFVCIRFLFFAGIIIALLRLESLF